MLKDDDSHVRSSPVVAFEKFANEDDLKDIVRKIFKW